MPTSSFIKDRVIKSLIEMGVSGFFPLFEIDWIKNSHQFQEMDETQKFRAQKIMDRLISHRGIDRKRTILDTLSGADRELFVKLFLAMVEEKFMDNRIVIH